MMAAYWFVVRRYWLVNLVTLFATLVFLGLGMATGYPGIAVLGILVVGIPMACILIYGGISRIAALGPSPSEEVLFSETWTSGHSNRNFFTKIGGARNVLTVQVTDGFLYIRPFLFAAHVADVGGLLHKVPLQSIIRCEKQPYQVFLEWKSEEGDESFVFRLRQSEEFVRCVEATRKAVAS